MKTVKDWITMEQKREWIKRNADNIGYLVKDYFESNYYNFIPIFTDGSREPEVGHVGT